MDDCHLSNIQKLEKKSGATPLTKVPALTGGGYNIPILGLSKPWLN